MITPDVSLVRIVRKYPIVEIEDVVEPFCGVRRKNLVPLFDAEPEIASEWLYEKNAGFGPEHFSRGSGVRCWWICSKCSRQYKAQICNRTTNRSACPYCASRKVCSDNSLHDLQPEIAAEFHPLMNGTKKASDYTKAANQKVWWLCKTCQHSWICAVSDRSTLKSGCPACYEARMQYAREHPKPYEKKRIIVEAENDISRAWYEKPSSSDFDSIAVTHLSVARQWHPTKNGRWTAWDFSKGSDATVWWKCKKGPDHEWQAPVYSRTGRKKSGCPFCSGRQVSVTNNLKKRFPEIAKEWHPKLNGDLKPEDVTYGSSFDCWWRCKKFPEHEWQTKVTTRTHHNSGCPFCAGFAVSEQNSLKTLFPYIAAQIHPTKNNGVTGDEVTANSAKRLFWICNKSPEHVWQTTVHNRTSNGNGCPFCSGRKTCPSESLAALYPDIAKEWDNKKNGKLQPTDVRPTAQKKVWWRCKRNHSWQQWVWTRIKFTGECHECRTGQAKPKRQKSDTRR